MQTTLVKLIQKSLKIQKHNKFYDSIWNLILHGRYELALSFQPTVHIKYEACIMTLPSYDSV